VQATTMKSFPDAANARRCGCRVFVVVVVCLLSSVIECHSVLGFSSGHPRQSEVVCVKSPNNHYYRAADDPKKVLKPYYNLDDDYATRVFLSTQQRQAVFKTREKKHMAINDNNDKHNNPLSRPRAIASYLILSVAVLLLAVPHSPAVAAEGGTPALLSSLSQSNAFRALRREPIMSQARRQLEDLKDLEDSRLDQCADRGVYWEQCFMFGESNTRTPTTSNRSTSDTNTGGNGDLRVRESGLDNQLLSPIGAFEPGSTSRPGKSSKPPTW
jgi:hypothetical protein